MENILFLVITLVCGVIGAKVATTVIKILSLGTALNILVGMAGGIIGAATIHLLGIQMATGVTDISGIINSASVSGLAGGLLMTLIGVLKISVTKNTGHKSDKHYA